MEHIEWIAGIIEGEGSISIYDKPISANVVVAVVMTDEDVIRALQERTGLGRVYKHGKPQKAHHKQGWRWLVYRKAEVEQLLVALLPHLFSRRRERAAIALDMLNKYKRKLPMGIYTSATKGKYRVHYKGEYIGVFDSVKEAEDAYNAQAS